MSYTRDLTSCRGCVAAVPLDIPEPDTVLSGPFWPCPVKVIRATLTGNSLRVQAEGTADGQYYDRILSVAQFTGQVREVTGGSHQFDADPRLFRLAGEALRTHLSHAFDPQFAISVSQVDPLPHQIDAVYRHILPLPRIFPSRSNRLLTQIRRSRRRPTSTMLTTLPK